MTELTVIKRGDGSFVPVDAGSQEEAAKFKIGQPVRFKATRQRNYQFHKKWFALVGFAYDHWEVATLQDPKFEGVKPEKNFDRFRKDITILAGFYDATYRVDGSVRIEAKSISFAAMSQDEFDRLYEATFTAIHKRILPHYQEQELHDVINQLLEFA
ncbi:MAG: DUF1367 family protein [Dichotomicrobium sp.]